MTEPQPSEPPERAGPPEHSATPHNIWSPPTPTPALATAGFGAPPATRRRSFSQSFAATTGDFVAGGVAAVAMVLAGIPFGLVWAATAPKVDVAAVFGNQAGALEAQTGADVHFALLGAVFGIVGGLLAGWRARRAGWPVPLGLVVGGLLGSMLAGKIGDLRETDRLLDQAPPTASALGRQLIHFMVRAEGFHVVYPLLAVLTFLVVVVTTTRAEPLTAPEAPDPGQWWSAPR